MAKAVPPRVWLLAAIGLPVIAGAIFAARSGKLNPYGDAANYRVFHHPPSGYRELPHAPQTLFLYRNIADHVLLRGAANQIVAGFNPSPDLDTDAVAQLYVDCTHRNMPGWTAEMLEAIPAGNTRFRLIRREKLDKTVVTAYAVKGNTTLMVTLSGNKGEREALEREMPAFREFLKTISFERQDMARL